MRASLLSLSLFLIGLVLAPLATAQSPFVADLEARLTATASIEDSRFGLDADADGGRAIVAGNSAENARASIFVRAGADWVQEFSAPFPGSPASATQVGVAIDGDVAVVGDPSAPAGNDSPGGVATVYERQGGSWVQTATLAPGSLTGTAQFGFSVDIDGDRIVVGALFNGADLGGSAFVFGRSGSSWIQTARLDANDAAEQDYFGYAVAVDGDRIVVGAPLDDDRGESSGSAYVFERDGGTWTQTDKLRPGANTEGAIFGVSVSLQGDRVGIGASGEAVGALTQAGTVYLFTHDGAAWPLDEKLTRAEPAAGDAWGWRLDLGADRLVVGTSGGAGADVLARAGDGWAQETPLVHPDGPTNSDGSSRAFGFAVALDGQLAIVTAPREDEPGPPEVSDAGAAYVYDLGVFVAADGAPTADGLALSAPAPNPTRERAALTLSLAAPGRAVATLHDALGRRVAVLLDREVSGSVRLDVPTADLAPGVYTVRVETAGGAAARRLSVVR